MVPWRAAPDRRRAAPAQPRPPRPPRPAPAQPPKPPPPPPQASVDGLADEVCDDYSCAPSGPVRQTLTGLGRAFARPGRAVPAALVGANCTVRVGPFPVPESAGGRGGPGRYESLAAVDRLALGGTAEIVDGRAGGGGGGGGDAGLPRGRPAAKPRVLGPGEAGGGGGGGAGGGAPPPGVRCRLVTRIEGRALGLPALSVSYTATDDVRLSLLTGRVESHAQSVGDVRGPGAAAWAAARAAGLAAGALGAGLRGAAEATGRAARAARRGARGEGGGSGGGGGDDDGAGPAGPGVTPGGSLDPTTFRSGGGGGSDEDLLLYAAGVGLLWVVYRAFQIALGG